MQSSLQDHRAGGKQPWCRVGLFVGVVQSLNHVWLFSTPWTAARQAPLSSTVSWSLLKFMSFESVMPSNHLILCRPLLPSIFPHIRVFSGGQSIGASASSSVLPVNNQGWFSFDWFDLLAFQGTLKSLLPHHNSLY